MSTVADRLDTATRAHAEYRAQSGAVNKKGVVVRRKNHQAARTTFQVARTALRQALERDPDMRDPAWETYRAAHRGVCPRVMLAFYDTQHAKPERPDSCVARA